MHLRILLLLALLFSMAGCGEGETPAPTATAPAPPPAPTIPAPTATPAEPLPTATPETLLGVLLTGEVQRGSIDEAGKQTSWSLSGEPDENVHVVIETTSGTLQPFAALYNSAGYLLASSIPSSDFDAYLETTLPTSDTYTLNIMSYGEKTGMYQVTLYKADSGVRPVEYGQTVTDYIADTDGRVWKFDGDTGQIATVAMNSQTFNSYLELYAPDGQLLASNDDGGAPTNSLIDGYLLLSGPGKYAIVAKSADGTGRGEYELTLTLGETLDLDAFGAGGRIEFGQTVEGVLRKGDKTTWTFEGQPSQAITITIAMNSDTFDTYVDLYSPNGELLASDDDSGPGYNALISGYVLPPSTGTYGIVARSVGDGQGIYELTLLSLP